MAKVKVWDGEAVSLLPTVLIWRRCISPRAMLDAVKYVFPRFVRPPGATKGTECECTVAEAGRYENVRRATGEATRRFTVLLGGVQRGDAKLFLVSSCLHILRRR